MKKFAAGVAGVLLLITPIVTSADQMSDLQAQVQLLLAKMSALQAQQSGGTTVTTNTSETLADDYGTSNSGGTTCPNLSTTFQRGARDVTTGGQVSELQLFLANQFNLNEEDVVSGFFGPTTHKYVVQFQTDQGLPAYGIVGSLTRAAIAKKCTQTGPTTYLDGNNHCPDYQIPICAAGQVAEKYTTSAGCYAVKCAAATVTSTNAITVTAPNGGEQWEIGQLNTITWAPYSYTPTTVNGASDVDVYLIDLSGNKAGKVMDQGKASLHTYFNINDYSTFAKPGQYYVYAVNRVTGASDKSDAPFTLLQRAVDLKINGSDGPVTVSDNAPIMVSWLIGQPYSSMEGGCTLSGVRTSPGGALNTLPVSGNSSSGTYYAYAPYAGAIASVRITCVDGAKGLSHADYASLSSSGSATSASLNVVSPNGGEQFDSTKQQTISWQSTGLGALSVALYMNDTWYAWISKNEGLTSEKNSLVWTPQNYIDNAAAWGKVFKIYITGQKSDGTGYVDDKSDAPFGFTATTPTPPPAPTPTLSISISPATGNYSGYPLITSGASPQVTWTSSGMSSCSIKKGEPSAAGSYDEATINTGWSGTSGSQNAGSITEATIYFLRCISTSGQTYNANARVYVSASAAATVTINAGYANTTSANGALSGPVGSAISVYWSANQASSCVLSRSPVGTLNGSTSGTFSNIAATIESQPVTYTVNCLPSGSASVIVSPTAAPSATINASSLQQSAGTYMLSGTAVGTTVLRVKVTTISAAGSAAGAVQTDKTTVGVINGGWSTTANASGVGTYKVEVFNGVTLLTSGTLTVALNPDGGGNGGASASDPLAQMAGALLAIQAILNQLAH